MGNFELFVQIHIFFSNFIYSVHKAKNNAGTGLKIFFLKGKIGGSKEKKVITLIMKIR